MWPFQTSASSSTCLSPLSLLDLKLSLNVRKIMAQRQAYGWLLRAAHSSHSTMGPSLKVRGSTDDDACHVATVLSAETAEISVSADRIRAYPRIASSTAIQESPVS